MEFFTIGAYNSSEEIFFNKLKEHNIDTFADLRQRRGVRGLYYTFANKERLRSKLQAMDIRYKHIKELAPTTRIRSLQDSADKLQKISRKKRSQLTREFSDAYEQEILSSFDFSKFLQKLENSDSHKIVLFCVEELPEACHRSIVAKKLNDLGYQVTHL